MVSKFPLPTQVDVTEKVSRSRGETFLGGRGVNNETKQRKVIVFTVGQSFVRGRIRGD